jgi:hypothetical protein
MIFLKDSKMKKMIIVCVSFLFFASIVFAMNRGQEKMNIDGGKRGIVPFPHHVHQKALADDCNSCHQVFPKKSGIIKQMKTEKKLKSKEIMNTQCIKCHKDLRKKNKPHGPTSCSQCHVK